MAKKNINNKALVSSNSAIELLTWPFRDNTGLSFSPLFVNDAKSNPVIAFQTFRFHPQKKLIEIKTTSKTELPYTHFNLGLHVGDNIESVVKNRQFLQSYIENHATERTNIQWLEQVHGNNVVEVTSHTENSLIADASITREKNIALAIMTADCLPILLCNTQGTEIAAIHGGWRPLAGNIIKNTLAKMHSDIKEIHVWLGPCIGKDAFEVGEDVKLAFTRENANFSEAFIQQANGKFLADLQLLATLQLNELGIADVTLLAECTFNQADKYYSYRRDSMTGRMASIISLT